MDPQELVPLEAGTRTWPAQARKQSLAPLTARSCLRGPLRLCRLLILLIVVPSLFIFVPLYLRYRVFSGQMYPMSMTDMRLIDSKISTTWCQRQVVRSNATFNAFVVPGPPHLADELVPVSMTRQLELEDDMKEYWGFYLLKGSTVTVSACTRWPGASLIMIKGYKHLQECAYIGDDSSEELDELLEAHQLGLLDNVTLLEKLEVLKKQNNDQKAINPGTMKRHKAGVSFHDPSHTENVTSEDSSVPAFDVTDHDPKELRAILERLHALRQAAKTETYKHYKPPNHLMSLPALHRHRDANVDKNERRWLSFKDIDGNNSEQATTQVQLTLETATDPTNVNETIINIHQTTVLNNETIIKHTENTFTSERKNIYKEITNSSKVNEINKNSIDVDLHKLIKEADGSKGDNEKTKEGNQKNKENYGRKITVKEQNPKNEEVFTTESSYFNEKEYTSNSPQEEPNSKEVFEDVLRRLEALGDRGKRVLVRLHETLGVAYHEHPSPEMPDLMSSVKGSSEELDRLRRVLVEAIDEEKTRELRQQHRRDARSEARAKRELMLGQVELTKLLNEDDEPRNYAAEEGLEPDGFAEHHTKLNETTAFDMSNSEFWSSFSSSEEALLECDGLILNLPLTPHSMCKSGVDEDKAYNAAKANALTYRVPANGYYFFVFNSENEVQTNFIRAKFDLQKTRYDVARTKLRECTNSTERCDLSLDIFSSQRVVLEVPLRDNDSLWNEQFVIISECEPRTSVYLVCVIAVPILILVFAFQ